MPITPGAAGASFDVLLAFSLDPQANQRVQQGITTLEQELKRIREEAQGVGESYEKSGEKVKDTSKQMAQDLRAQARAMRAEAASLSNDVRAVQIGLLRDLSGAIQDISTKALVTGGAIVGGIFAEVQNYVSKAPEATRETRAWAAATADLGRARERVDQELLRTALPLLQQAARVANQAASIVESHPEITSMALKAGAILVGVGVIGTAVSRGIKLVADIQYLATIPTQLTAAKLQDIAADKQLAAAQIQFKGGGNIPGGGGGAGKTIGTIGLVGTGLALASSIILGTSKAMDELSKKLISMGGIAEAVGQGIAASNHGIFPAVKNLLGLGDAAEKAGDAFSEASGRIRGSANEAEIVEAFTSWREDDSRLIREAAENRKDILREAEREIAQITRDYASQRVDINRQFNENRANIIREFEEANLEADRRYREERSQVIEDGNQRIRDLEESHQERLRQMREESESRIEELSAARDALGIVKEQRRLAEAEQEESRSFRREAARARRETEERLAQLDSQYAAERARRQAQFEQDLKENEAQRAAELAQAAEAYQREITQAREAQAQKLRDLQEGLDAERQRRREVFIEQIRDLDASLLGERALRQERYNEMLRDAENFFNQYRATMPSGRSFGSVSGSVGTIPNQDVLETTTKAVAAAVGGVMAQTLATGDTRTAVYNDQRRLSYPLSKTAKREFEETAKRALRDALGVVS